MAPAYIWRPLILFVWLFSRVGHAEFNLELVSYLLARTAVMIQGDVAYCVAPGLVPVIVVLFLVVRGASDVLAKELLLLRILNLPPSLGNPHVIVRNRPNIDE